MSDAGPPPAPPSSTASWAVGVLRTLTINNVLTLGVLAVVAAPSYFAYRFLSDTEFRHEFMSTARVDTEAGVPCQVVIGNLAGGRGGDRYSIFVGYKSLSDFEYLVALRSRGLLTHTEIVEACNVAHTQTDLMLWAIDQKEEMAREAERAKANH